MCALAALVLAGLPALAQAESFPALFDVTDVAADDVLNIRAEPSARATVTGSFASDVTGIEVVTLAPGGAWGRVNAGESAGWVAMRYLARQPAPDWQSLQQPLRCFGTEPFWSATLAPGLVADGGEIQLSGMGGAVQSLPVTWAAPVAGRTGMLGLGLAGGGFATLTGAACSDGMSDRDFGISVSIFPGPIHPGAGAQNGATAPGLAGCCTLSR